MITPSQTEITLQDMNLGESQLFEVVIANTYPFTVHVGVTPGCQSCTIAALHESPNIPPNGTAVLKAKFSPKTSGNQAKSIKLAWVPQDDNKLKELTIRFKANVIGA